MSESNPSRPDTGYFPNPYANASEPTPPAANIGPFATIANMLHGAEAASTEAPAVVSDAEGAIADVEAISHDAQLRQQIADLEKRLADALGRVGQIIHPTQQPAPAATSPASTPPATAARPAVAGGSGQPAPDHLHLLPVPAWSQQIDDNPGGEPPDTFWATDCGEQSCAMVTYACDHIELPEGVIRGYLKDQYPDMTDGRSTAEMLAWYLSSPHSNFPHAAALDADWPTLHTAIKDHLNAGQLPLVLGAFYAGALHWVVGRGYDDTWFAYNDPWTGTQRAMTWDQLAAIQAGAIVLTHGHAQYS